MESVIRSVIASKNIENKINSLELPELIQVIKGIKFKKEHKELVDNLVKNYNEYHNVSSRAFRRVKEMIIRFYQEEVKL